MGVNFRSSLVTVEVEPSKWRCGRGMGCTGVEFGEEAPAV